MKRISDEQRVEQIFNSADLAAAQRYLAIAGAILRARFPQAVKIKTVNHRKPKAVTERAGGATE